MLFIPPADTVDFFHTELSLDILYLETNFLVYAVNMGIVALNMFFKKNCKKKYACCIFLNKKGEDVVGRSPDNMTFYNHVTSTI